MPLVPGSLRQNTEDDWEAKFRDPVANTVIPVFLQSGMSEDGYTTVDARMQGAMANAMGGYPVFSVDESDTEPEYRRRGYMTALYDAIAAMLDKNQWGSLHPSGFHTPEGMRFWESVLGEGAGLKGHGQQVYWPDGAKWPVRDDL